MPSRRIAELVLLMTALAVLLAGGGCSPLPKLYREIELDRPFDPAVLPEAALIERAGPTSWQATTAHQVYLPVGMVRYTLSVELDRGGYVKSVTLEEYSVYYWILLLSGGNTQRVRRLDESCKEQSETDVRPMLMGLLPNAHVFMMGVAQCFGVAADYRQQLRAQQAPDAPPDAEK